MSYIILPDIYMQIQPTQFESLQTGDTSIYETAKEVAAEEVRTHLQPKYDLSAEFMPLLPYDNTTTYKGGQRVYLDAPAYSNTATYAIGALSLYNGNVYRCSTAISTGEAFDGTKWSLIGARYAKYYVTLPKPAFDMYATYLVSDEVFYKDHTYKCLIATTSVSQQGALNYQSTASIPRGNVQPDDRVNGSTYWQDMGAYSVASGTLPTDSTKWTAGDNRNKLLVAHYVAMVLYHMHSRTAGQNIPVLRVERYMGKEEDRAIKNGRTMFPEYSALGFLQAASLGRNSASLPVIQPLKGRRLRWTSQPKNINNY